jgi:hypothetical protein
MSAAVTPLRPDIAALALTDDLRTALQTAVDAVTPPTTWRQDLMSAAAKAHANGVGPLDFTGAADFCFHVETVADRHTVVEEPPELAALTRRQQAIWRTFRDRWRRHHLSPTLRDVMRALGITSTSVVDYNLKRLAAKGLIEHSPGTTPAYRLPAKWR